MIRKIDKKNKFVSMFNPDTGFYMRSGVIDENGKDTGVDPFMTSFPELLDIGIMQTCVCSHRCNVDCYQKAIERTGKNMSIKDFESILKQSQGKLFQVALGGAGDVDTHENFEEIVKLCREYKIVPNFTTSGILMTEEKAEICKKYCGAVAVSWYRSEYTINAIKMLLDAGVKTNIHYVLGNNTIDEAIDRLHNDSFPHGINAIVFLLHKPAGQGTQQNVLAVDDPKVAAFFAEVDNIHPYKVGLDSCNVPGAIRFCKHILPQSLDTCEGARFSCYIDSDMTLLPCSFDQKRQFAVQLKPMSIEDGWNSDTFERFRKQLKNSCPGCEHQDLCKGGCPLLPEIVFCNKEERKIFKEEK